MECLDVEKQSNGDFSEKIETPVNHMNVQEVILIDTDSDENTQEGPDCLNDVIVEQTKERPFSNVNTLQDMSTEPKEENATSLSKEIKSPVTPTEMLVDDLKVVLQDSPIVNVSKDESSELNVLMIAPGLAELEKNTFINGLKNYSTYKTLEDAEKGEECRILPMQFTILDHQYKEITIGWSSYELQDDGNNVKSYKFVVGNKTVHIIDAPGVTDSSKDNAVQLKNILQHLQSVKKIHSVLILLKPNIGVNEKMKTYINEILSHLHRDVIKQKVFCFINTRNFFYRPGSSLQSLQTIFGVDEVPTDPEANKNIVYCFEDEAVLFLAALKNKVTFNSIEYDNFSTSWQQVNQEATRLFQYLSQLQPLNTESVMTVKESRELIEVVQKPLIDISNMINDNIHNIESVLENRNSFDQDFSNICPSIKTLKFEELPHYRTVCMSSTCAVPEIENSSPKAPKFYRNVCHDKCRVYSHRLLACCSCFDWSRNCKYCGCKSYDHSLVNFGTSVHEKKFELVSGELLSKKAQVEGDKIVMEDIQRCVESLYHEQAKILNIVALLTYFLQKNVQTGDKIQDYITLLVNERKQKEMDGSFDEKLENMLTKYLHCLEKTEKELQSEVEIKTVADVLNLLESLYPLTYMGESIKSLVLQASSKKNVKFQLKSTNSPSRNQVNGNIKQCSEATSDADGILGRIWKFGKRRFGGYFGPKKTDSNGQISSLTSEVEEKEEDEHHGGKRIKLGID